MFAGVVYGKNDIRYEEIRTPKPEAGQVMVKVKYTGICGSDVPRVNGTACHFYPMVLGHEFSGVISEVGEGVTSVRVGDRVAGVPLVPCMKCDDCLKGNYSLCRQYSFVGSRQYGSFAEYVVVPEKNVYPFDDKVTFEQGALFEPSAVALHALRVAGFEGGRTAAVVGTGTIGLLTLQWARIFGASSLTAINRSRGKLETAGRLGADHILSTLDEDYYEQAMEITGEKGFDYVFDATGNGEIMKESLRLAAGRGTVCYIGTPKKPISFTVQEWERINRKEMSVTGSWMSYSAPFPGEEWELTAYHFNKGDLILDEAMIGARFPLSRIDEAFELFKTPGKVKGKILINSEQ